MLVLFSASLLISCQSVNGITISQPQDTETQSISEQTSSEIDAIFPAYDTYDRENFLYADVRIVFAYDAPAIGMTREEKKSYFEENNQAYFSNSGLENAQYDDVYLSMYTPFMGMSYGSKKAFLEDFDLIKQGYIDGYYGQVEVYLNTVGRQYYIDETSTLEDLISLTDLYFGTEITYDKLAYTLLANTLTDELEENKVYEHMSDYLEDYPSNPYDVEASLFETQVLIVVAFGHSGSITVEGIEAVFYLDDNTLEVAIEASAGSTLMTTDFWPRSIVLSLSKDDYHSDVVISPHFHTFYSSGTYADRPYHNTVDQKNE